MTAFRFRYVRVDVDCGSTVGELWVITESKLVSTGAAVTAMFTSFLIKSVKSIDLISLD
jgi:hypothetical protein